MNTCHNPTSPPLAPPAPTQPRRFAWPSFNRFIRIAGLLSVDLMHFFFFDRPGWDSTPRMTFTHYR